MQISDIKVHTIIFTIQFIASELLAKSLAIFRQNCISMYLLQNRHLKRHFIKKNIILIIMIIKSTYNNNIFFLFRLLCIFLLQFVPMFGNQTLCKTFDWNRAKKYGKHCGNFATRTQSASHRP